MFRFSDETLTNLYKAGWSDERRIDAVPFQQRLQQYDYPVFPIVLHFIKCFGGLKFKYPHPFGGWEVLDLTLEDSDVARWKDCADDVGEWLGVPVCFIGEANTRMVPLFMSERGVVYGEADTYLWIGSSGPDAIEALCTKRKAKFAEQGSGI